MGLTIHYHLHTTGGITQARRLVHALHDAAQALPFKELDPVVELQGDACNFDKRTQDDPLRWLLCQAQEYVDIGPGRSMGVAPSHLIAFSTWPGEGCESANFGLCKYPATVKVDGRTIRTKLSGWHWSSFCKTQYASSPDCGGVPNFLSCHLMVVNLLDQAQKLGCLKSVSDEGDFWEKRNLSALAAEVGSWNQMIAALGGKLKDALEGGPVSVQAPITSFANFESLEAAGQADLHPGFDGFIPLIQHLAKLAEDAKNHNDRPQT
jgi:hypothetical protein